MTQVRLDERDFGKLTTRLMYGVNCKRPRRNVLVCACGHRSESLQRNVEAWNGWQVVPFAKCPACLGKKETHEK